MVAENKNPPPVRWQRVFGIVLRWFGLVQRLQHDRRPATGVVVVPVSMMMATCVEHCPGLIPDNRDACQTFPDGALLFLSQRHQRIDFRRSSGGKITGKQRNYRQRNND